MWGWIDVELPKDNTKYKDDRQVQEIVAPFIWTLTIFKKYFLENFSLSFFFLFGNNIITTKFSYKICCSKKL